MSTSRPAVQCFLVSAVIKLEYAGQMMAGYHLGSAFCSLYLIKPNKYGSTLTTPNILTKHTSCHLLYQEDEEAAEQPHR